MARSQTFFELAGEGDANHFAEQLNAIAETIDWSEHGVEYVHAKVDEADLTIEIIVKATRLGDASDDVKNALDVLLTTWLEQHGDEQATLEDARRQTELLPA